MERENPAKQDRGYPERKASGYQIPTLRGIRDTESCKDKQN
jgi:hypothetical protein